MDDLTEFIKARLDEDEAAARAAEHNDGPGTLEWRVGGPRHLTFDNHRSEDYVSVFAGGWDRILIARDEVRGAPLAKHIARHDPARVLREVAAKRAILNAHISACTADRVPHPGATVYLDGYTSATEVALK